MIFEFEIEIFEYMHKESFLKKKMVNEKEEVHMQVLREDENVYDNMDTMSVMKNRLKKLMFVI